MLKTLRSALLGVTALCLLLLPASVTAQSVSGDLVGTIYDATGAIVAGASVGATNVDTGVQSSTVSSSTGQYRISNLPVGSYNLKVSAKGFGLAELRNVAVNLSVTSTANITLQIGESKTVVEVTGSAAVIDTTTAQVESNFDAKQMADLPTTSGGSGVLNLALYTSGVSSSGTTGIGVGPSVGGQRPTNNNFMIEGIDNNSKANSGPLGSLPNDAVAEFSILANQFSPQYGHSSGGQFNSVVKSGTNEFHGSGYEYLSNRNLNAADQINVVNGVDLHPRSDNNRFGGTIGGPIKKNKLFFFFDYEYNPVGSSGSGGQIFAPTTNGYSVLSGISSVSANNLATMKEYLPAQSTATDPANFGGAYPTVDGKSIEMGQYSFLAPNYSNSYTYLISVDYTLSDKDQLRGRYIRNNYLSNDTAANLPTFWVPLKIPNYVATLSEFHNFSPNLTNEFRLGFNRNNAVYDVGSQKFPGLTVFPNLTIDELGVNIGPDPNAPQGGIQNLYQGTDNLTWLKGAHTLTAGADLKKYISPQYFTQRARGDYEWDTLENYLTDQIPYFGERTTGNFIYYGDQIQAGAYVNDSWKIKPNFTINLGMRYERTTIPYGERLQTINSISNVPGLISFGSPKTQNLNFEPRVGFAWSPGTSGKTSIRGGFGINYDQLRDNLGLLSAAPQFQQTVDVGGNAGSNFLANGAIPDSASSGSMTAAEARSATSGYIPDQKLPKSLQWNIGIQRVIKEDYTVEVRYLGTRGINLSIQDRLNVGSVVTPQNALPVYLSAPSQATLDSLTSTLGNLTKAYNAGGQILPQYASAGFDGNYIVGFMPMGASTYHGLASQVIRRFHNGLQFVGSYTFSHNIDNSTADVFSTYTNPRRVQDFQNLNAERSSSALDHRQRFTLATVYDLPFFKGRNWFLRNIVGNWEMAPIYTYETGSLVTPQSATDSNLNGDAAGDRTVLNPLGQVNVGSATTQLKNSGGDVVAYLAVNPNARYIQAPKGALSTAGRQTEHLRPINNIDFSLLKRFNVFKERYKLEFGGRFYNFLNHPQYTGARTNDVSSIGYTGTDVYNFLNPTKSTFYQPDKVFTSNPRSIQVSAKFIF
jgi:hypothetical protein